MCVNSFQESYETGLQFQSKKAFVGTISGDFPFDGKSPDYFSTEWETRLVLVRDHR